MLTAPRATNNDLFYSKKDDGLSLYHLSIRLNFEISSVYSGKDFMYFDFCRKKCFSSSSFIKDAASRYKDIFIEVFSEEELLAEYVKWKLQNAV